MADRPAPKLVPPETAPVSSDTPGEELLAQWVGRVVVLDTQGALLYVGTLLCLSDRHYVLGDADVHHATESRTTKDLYLVETRDLGVKVNRTRVVVERREIVSISLLGEIRS